jgi:hypothetical protein
MDGGTATVIAALIGAITTVTVAFISTRPQSDRPQSPPTNAQEIKTSSSGGINTKVSTGQSPDQPRLKATTSRVRKGALWLMYFVSVFCVIGMITGVFMMISPPPGPRGQGELITILAMYTILALIFVPITIRLRKRTLVTN